jgi:hypothetical protein
MILDPANAQELTAILSEVDTGVLEGTLRSPSKVGGWHLGHTDLSE